jgi:hypothetical protein
VGWRTGVKCDSPKNHRDAQEGRCPDPILQMSDVHL